MAIVTVRQLAVGEADVSALFSAINDPDLAACTFSVRLSTQPDVGVANSIHNTWATTLLTQQTNNYILERVNILYQADANNQISVDSTDPGVAGSLALPALPSNCAWLVRKHTLFAGRANRGRMYVPGADEDNVDGIGQVLPGRLAALATEADSFFLQLTGLAVVDAMILVHSCQFDDAVEPPCAPSPATQIIDLSVDDFIATQRRRMNR